MKTCTKCQITKDLNEFGLQRGKPRSICKNCRKLESKEWYKNNKERKRELSRKYKQTKKSQDLQRTYGITMEQYLEMCQDQNNVCKICEKPQTTERSLCVDHCHDTGIVRGLLCDKCNRGLGLLGDTEDSIQSALTYLRNAATKKEYL